MRRSVLARALIAILLLPLAMACSGGAPAASEAPNAVDQVDLKGPVGLTLWHTQTGANATALQTMVDDFNPTWPWRMRASWPTT